MSETETVQDDLLENRIVVMSKIDFCLSLVFAAALGAEIVMFASIIFGK